MSFRLIFALLLGSMCFTSYAQGPKRDSVRVIDPRTFPLDSSVADLDEIYTRPDGTNKKHRMRDVRKYIYANLSSAFTVNQYSGVATLSNDIVAWAKLATATRDSIINGKKKVRLSAVKPATSTYLADMVIDTVGVDTIYFWNNGTYVRFSAGSGGGGSQNLQSVLTQGNSASSLTITNLGAPSSGSDASNKTYVDAQRDSAQARLQRNLRDSLARTAWVTAADLQNTAVTAGSYGSNKAIPTLAVDQDGRLTSASVSYLQNAVTYVDTIPFNILVTDLGTKNISGTHVIKKRTIGAVAGFGAILRVVANGANVPTLVGFKKAVGSSTYNNQNGTVNLFMFLFDGVDYWYAIVNEVAGTNDVTPPTFVSASTNTAGTVIRIKFSENLNPDSTATNSSFTVSGGKTVIARSINLDTLFLTVNAAYVGSDVITVSYTRATARLQDPSGNLVANFTSQSVTNNTPIGNIPFTTRTNITQDLSNPSGTSLTSSSSTPRTALSDWSLPPGVDGWVSMKYNATIPNGTIIGFNTSNLNETFGGYEYLFYSDTGASNNYKAFGLGSNSSDGSVVTGTAALNGDIIRLRRTGTSVVAEYSRDSGSTWNTIRTFTRASSERLYFNIDMSPTKTVVINSNGLN